MPSARTGAGALKAVVHFHVSVVHRVFEKVVGASRTTQWGVHRHTRPLRAGVAAVLAQAAPAQPTLAQAEPVITSDDAPAVAPLGNAVLRTSEPLPHKRSARYLWTMLIAHI